MHVGAHRATYELTALVAHIEDEGSEATSASQEGHLVAHIKVHLAPFLSEISCCYVQSYVCEFN